MNSMIYNPVEEFDSKFKNLHAENTQKQFDELVRQSGVNPEANRLTVKQYEEHSEALAKLKKRLTLWKVLRVLACITLILIPLVILKLTPGIRAMREEIETAEDKTEALLNEAHAQMAPLMALFSDGVATDIIEATIPQLDFAPCFTAEQEADMKTNYDFEAGKSDEVSAADVLAGRYNGNPFLFENRLIHRMGTETYTGSITISWTETYTDSEGKTRTRVRTETLTASVTKPKPFYSTEVTLHYCAQAGDELSFSRDATDLDEKSERSLERYVKKGEKKLKKMTDEALAANSDFMSMSNTEFEVLFDALDRDNEVQFRMLFTPLAQTNMVELICDKVNFGDDFHFVKEKRTNHVTAKHSQGRRVNLTAANYASHSFDVIQAAFLERNAAFFKDVYFDFAPLWAIPVYQERPANSLKPIPEGPHRYAVMEGEALAHRLPADRVVHPATQTQAILKASSLGMRDKAEEFLVKAYSYDIVERVDYKSVRGGDGRWHSVPVHWDDYIPLENEARFFMAEAETLDETTVPLARRGNLCMYQ